MNITVPSRLPVSTLAPGALRYKFLSSFSGLGQTCIDWQVDPNTGDEYCAEYDNGTTGTGPTGSPSDFCSLFPTSPGCGSSSSLPSSNPPDVSFVTNWGSSGQAPYMDPAGNLILANPGGGYTIVTANGQTRTIASGIAPTPAASGGTITNSQAAMYASIVNSLANAGVRIATITSLQPGQTLLPNGAIIGAGQGIPGSGISAILSNPTMVIAVAVIAGVAIFGMVSSGR